MVDKNLFLHDLAVVAILKNEAPYLKEWLDYHLAAGVDHFYLYDNDSPDNQREVAAPYVEAGLVDYFPLPGKVMQYAAYNDAVKKFKFFSRYMAVIDGDEFIFPKSAPTIAEVVDEILSHDSKAAGVGIHWHCFGSNGHDKADYSLGVLERFTRRAPNDWTINGVLGNSHIKTIANPRRLNFFNDPHTMNYFAPFHTVDENLKIAVNSFPLPITAEKIVINHYHCKSREEFNIRYKRGYAANLNPEEHYTQEEFTTKDRNEEFDDDILRYRDERTKIYQPPDNSRADDRLLDALIKNLSPTLLPNTPQNFYRGKMETFLTCRAVASYLKSRLKDSATTKFFEEASLKAILRSFNGMNLADAQLLIRELPALLSLPYPAVKDIRQTVLKLIPQMMNVLHLNGKWRDYVELDYIQDMLKFKEAE